MKLHMVRWLRHILTYKVSDAEFNMAQFCYLSAGGCRTVGCMAGQLAIHAPKAIQNAWIRADYPYSTPNTLSKAERTARLDDIAQSMAAAHLGLTVHESNCLFVNTGADLHQITRQDAIMVLLHLEEKREINWCIIGQKSGDDRVGVVLKVRRVEA